MVTVIQNDAALLGRHVSFGCSTDIKRPYKWHWQRDGVLIAGAPSACAYTTPPLRAEDMGHMYSVTVFGLDGEIETSVEVPLSGPVVGPDSAPATVPAPDVTEEAT